MNPRKTGIRCCDKLPADTARKPPPPAPALLYRPARRPHGRYSERIPLTDEQQQEVNLRGSGRLRDLREAAAQSSGPAEVLQQYKNTATREEQPALRDKSTAKTPGKSCHKYAEKNTTSTLQGRNRGV